ncbi:MAG TPA: hypothetical protein VG937_28165 [Polyangiaceae bacterium]|nr:hypothetical protein [Polyangiaceae bacterium]
MRYRAVAVASERSNAVGTVELECTPHGLFIAYLGVGAFSQGYAPAALASGTGLTAPWAAVSEARVEGEQVFVVIDPKLSPLNRLLLTHFASGRSLPADELAKRRLVVRFAAMAAALIGALILGAWLIRSSPETSAGAAIALALLAAAVLFGLGFAVDRNLASSGDEHVALSGFAIELGHYLPALLRLPRTPEAPRPLPNISELQGLIPRTTLAIVITLTAGTLGVLLVARWVTTNENEVGRVTQRMLDPANPPAASPVQRAPAVAPVGSQIQSARTPTPPNEPAASTSTANGECRCARADSALWTRPFPRLSVLVLSQHVRLGRNADENKRKKYLELDVAVVNNSNKELDEVALMVLFYERDPPPSNKRTQISNRSLFFAGPLLPGQAIKWSVEAEGTEFEIQNPITGDIGPNGEDAAPTNRLAELLSAHNRPVRLHGAMLLAYLGDPRAKDGVLGLREALRDDEAPYLTRLIQALSDVRVCQLRQTPGSKNAAACVFNSSKEVKRDLGIKIRGLEHVPAPESPTAEPPTVLVESAVKFPGELAPDSGRSLQFQFDLAGQNPELLEAYADRYDLLR